MVEFRLSTFVIGLVLFSTMIVALSIPYANLGKNYKIKVDNEFNQTFDKVNYLHNQSVELGNTVQKEEVGALDVFFLVGKSIVTVPKIVFKSLGVVQDLLGTKQGLSHKLNIPPIFMTAFFSIVTISVAFAVINLWARWKT